MFVVIMKNKNEDFISRSKAIFVNQFNYKDCKYTKAKAEVKLWCTLHDKPVEVNVSPDKHLNKNKRGGCNECKKENARIRHQLSKEEIIARIEYRFGNKFGYKRLEYINAKTPIELYCKKHKEYFHVIPDTIKIKSRKGFGCKKCVSKSTKRIEKSSRKSSIYREERINKLKEKLRNKFQNLISLKDTTYISEDQDAAFICSNHGNFRKKPKNVIRSKIPCNKCRQIKPSEKILLNKININLPKRWMLQKFIYNKNHPLKSELLIQCKYHPNKKNKILYTHLKKIKKCPQCKNENNTIKSQEIRFAKLTKKLSKNISLKKTNILINKNIVIFQCDKHGKFEKKYDSIRQKSKIGCDLCSREKNTLINSKKDTTVNTHHYLKLHF